MHRVSFVVTSLSALLGLGCEFVPRETTDGTTAPSTSGSAPVAPSASVTQGAVTESPPSPSSAPVVGPSERSALAPKVRLSPGAEAARLAVNQLRVVPADPWVKTKALHEVTVYVVFRDAFARHLELRAEDADGAELGRSERQAALTQPADSARYLSFRFDARMPLDKVAAFVAHVDPLPEPLPPPSKNIAMKPIPKPQPEPQFLRSPGPDLVPKNP